MTGLRMLMKRAGCNIFAVDCRPCRVLWEACPGVLWTRTEKIFFQ